MDRELIVSSFAQQYGIRLLREDISVQEYRQLLKGINGKTPLGYVVYIRSETDPEKIKNFTADEKRIVREWREFRMRQGVKPQVTISWQELQSVLKSFAGGG